MRVFCDDFSQALLNPARSHDAIEMSMEVSFFWRVGVTIGRSTEAISISNSLKILKIRLPICFPLHHLASMGLASHKDNGEWKFAFQTQVDFIKCGKDFNS